jgi:hypothetical protein
MIRVLRVGLGVLLGFATLGVLWFTGLLPAPEGLRRDVAVWSAVYPGDVEAAVVERVACPPLRRLSLYVVCTAQCDDVWRIVGVRGLRAENLVNLNRIPPEPPEEPRRRINAAIARERLDLDEAGAREMIGCFLRLDGMHPELILERPDVGSVQRARGSEEELHHVAQRLDRPDAISRLSVTRTDDGFVSTFYYWDTATEGRPILELRYVLRRDGRLRSIDVGAYPDEGTIPGTASAPPPG